MLRASRVCWATAAKPYESGLFGTFFAPDQALLRSGCCC